MILDYKFATKYTLQMEQQVRESRRKICEQGGQASPSYLTDYVFKVLQQTPVAAAIGDGMSIVDVGCGKGEHADRFRQLLGTESIDGIDFSKSTYDYLKEKSIYRNVFHCSSDELPFEDGQFGLAISMENMEHLYFSLIRPAISELVRVAEFVVITTPTPLSVINRSWLNAEIEEAGNDPVALTEHDYHCLASTVHKSVLIPRSMEAAGFSMTIERNGNQAIYFGRSSEIDPFRIRYLGLRESTAGETFQERYVDLLRRSLDLRGICMYCHTHADEPVSIRF